MTDQPISTNIPSNSTVTHTPIHTTNPEGYNAQLAEKCSKINALMQVFTPPKLEVFDSPKEHYRMRAEFKMWQQGETVSYAMFQPGKSKQPFIINDFPIASIHINQLMPRLLSKLNQSELLRKRLFQAEFLSTLAGEVLVTLIYHKPLGEDWLLEAEKLRSSLGVDLIGRSRKQKNILGSDYVTEKLEVDGNTFFYQQVEASFTQPNAIVSEKMLAWAVDCTKPLQGDLLELYCGNGNFTIPLSFQFTRVLATEISKTSVHSAQYNMKLNNADNIQIARMSSEEFAQAMDKQRLFRRLKDIDLDHYNFSTVLVDPPRAGLDQHTIEIVQRFENILYISCNPETLKRDLEIINQTHKIERFALFDQFPYTHHIESGIMLSKR